MNLHLYSFIKFSGTSKALFNSCHITPFSHTQWWLPSKARMLWHADRGQRLNLQSSDYWMPALVSMSCHPKNDRLIFQQGKKLDKVFYNKISWFSFNSDICCPPWGLLMCEPWRLFFFIGFPVLCVTCQATILHEFHSVSFHVCRSVLLHVISWLSWLNRRQSQAIAKVTKHPF